MSAKREPKNEYVPRPEARAKTVPKLVPRDTDLTSERWKLATVAWTPEGDVVVLDPALRAKLLELDDRGDRLVIGLPPASGAQVGDTAGSATDPWPEGQPKSGLKPVPILELCMCDGRLFRLEKIFRGQLKQSVQSGVSVPSNGS